jgi:hypothetical protein
MLYRGNFSIEYIHPHVTAHMHAHAHAHTHTLQPPLGLDLNN